MSSPRFQIPWARDLENGRLIRADRAELHPPRGRYICLDERCHQPLTVARSNRGLMHFRHFRDGRIGPCHFHRRNGSRAQHAHAQALLQAVFEAAIHRLAPMPVLHFSTPEAVLRILPFILAERVVTEWVCPVSKRRADLAILDRFHEPVLLVEVFHTHAVDHEKRLDLLPYWWIEVGAGEVLHQPLRLNVLDCGNLPYDLEVLGHQRGLFD